MTLAWGPDELVSELRQEIETRNSLQHQISIGDEEDRNQKKEVLSLKNLIREKEMELANLQSQLHDKCLREKDIYYSNRELNKDLQRAESKISL
jgi:hypothetical protein